MSEDGEIAEVAGEAGAKLGLFRGLAGLFRRPAAAEDEWVYDATNGTYLRRGYGYDPSYLDYAKEPPPPDPTMQAPGYTTVYRYHGLDKDALMPKYPAKDKTIGTWTVADREAGNVAAARHAMGDENSPFVTVTTDRVDPAGPPGKGRNSEFLVSTFRVPDERLFNPAQATYKFFSPALPKSAEAGERYFLGNDLLVYKVGEKVNPFAGQNRLGTFEEYGP